MCLTYVSKQKSGTLTLYRVEALRFGEADLDFPRFDGVETLSRLPPRRELLGASLSTSRSRDRVLLREAEAEDDAGLEFRTARSLSLSFSRPLLSIKALLKHLKSETLVISGPYYYC